MGGALSSQISCHSVIHVTDSYGDGVNAFFKVEYFDPWGLLSDTEYSPANFGGSSTLQIFFDGPGQSIKVSVIPTFKNTFEPCDVGVNANATDCDVINEPWELTWLAQNFFQRLFSSTRRSYYGGVDSVLELRCDPKFDIFQLAEVYLNSPYVSPGSYLDLISTVPLITQNIATAPSAKPRSKEYAGPAPACKGINLDMADKSGKGWFRHESATYSEYIVSSNNEVFVRGTMVKPAYHEKVEVSAQTTAYTDFINYRFI
jgi:hypothetical protein